MVTSKKRKIKFHDYDEIYQVPGLYEQIFYDRLKCTSPNKVTSILESAIKHVPVQILLLNFESWIWVQAMA